MVVGVIATTMSTPLPALLAMHWDEVTRWLPAARALRGVNRG